MLPIGAGNGKGKGGGHAEDSRPTYLDVPPSWDGKLPDEFLDGYVKSAKAWQRTTRVPKKQQGVQLISQPSGDLRIILSTLELDAITADDGAEAVIAHVEKEYEWVTQRSLVKKFEDAVYHSGRGRSESFLSYTAKIATAFQQLARAGCDLPSTAKGLIALRGGNLSKQESDLIYGWLQ
eukprot:5453952-Amphidinium_carterae.1